MAGDSLLSDSGFTSPTPPVQSSAAVMYTSSSTVLTMTMKTTTTPQAATAARTTSTRLEEMSMTLDDTFVLSPPTVVRCEEGGSGSHFVASPPCQYFLRGHAQRWASTPLMHKEVQLSKSQSMPAATSTPANAAEFSTAAAAASFPAFGATPDAPTAQLSQAEFERRLSTAAAAAVDSSLDSSQHRLDSGIESLTTSHDASASEVSGGEASGYLAKSFLGALAKRRSPRRTVVCPAATATTTACGVYQQRLRTVETTDRLNRFRPGGSSSRTVTQGDKGYDDDYGSRLGPTMMMNRERVDFIRLLAERDLWRALDTVLEHLLPQDLCAFSLVCQVWSVTLASRRAHDERRRVFVQAKRLDRENFGAEAGLLPRRMRSSPRLAMQEISNTKNISPNSKRSRDLGPGGNLAVSPSKIRYRLFVEEAAKLPPGGRLVHCPHCSSPSRVQLVTRSSQAGSPSSSSSNSNSSSAAGVPEATEVATCSSATCGLVFCLACHCAMHEGPCRSLRSGANNSKRAGGVTSKKSKARLRRL